jgi:single-strand DNA-binding protein
MEQLNKVEIRGIIGSVRLQEVGDTKVARFTVATNIAYKAKDGCGVIETTWHNVSAFEGGEIRDLELLTKGSRVHVTGRMRSQSFIGDDGVKRNIHEIFARTLSILSEDEDLQYQM